MKILVTGSSGVIGTVLKNRLQHQITEFDLPKDDARDLSQLMEAAQGHYAIIHLAWNTAKEIWNSQNIEPDNSTMALNAYRAAKEAGIKRIIMASSVHTDNFIEPAKKVLTVDDIPTPTGAYGAHKIFIEALGRYYAGQGLQVICIRFGGISANNQPSETPVHKRVWLSHDDLTSLVKTCLDSPNVPTNFAVVYGVSDNPGRIHDLSNPFGWRPLQQ